MIPGVPYDAEIEYLESTGTQWIDTGVKTSTQGKFELTVSSTKDTSSTDTWGASGSSSTTNCLYSIRFMPSANSVRIYYDANHFKSYTINYLEKHTYAIDQKTGVCIVDGVSSTFTPIASTSFYGLFLFATSNLGTVGSKCKGKCYSAKIYDNSVLVRDLIPVRVGQTGYMYDRVTRRLFGNKGTGSFVLGPDVAKPVMGLWGMRKVYTADDYIKGGLVAMWDGIENAGRGQWGKNNPNATDWPALIGGETWGTGAKIVYNASGHYYDTNNVGQGSNLWFVPDTAVSFTDTFEFVVMGISAAARFRYLIKGSPAEGYNDIVRMTPDAMEAHYSGSSRVASVPLNTPTSFAMSNGLIYLNGLLATSASPPALSFSYLICPGNSANNVRGRIYAIRLYNRALSPAEIAHNYQIDKARFNLP